MGPACGSTARATIAVAAALSLALAGGPSARAAARPLVPVTREMADALVSQPPSGPRDGALADWARRATLDDVLWVLRRDSAALAAAELPLTSAALGHVPGARAELRSRLEARRQLLDSKLAHKAGRSPGELEALRPRASVFRVAALLPDRGEYAGYARSLYAALGAGLAASRAPSAPPISLEFHGTGDDEPVRGAAALDTVSRTCAAVVGELLSTPTFALATGARFLGLPLISPTATDEAIGRTGPTVFAVGPAGRERGRRLARAIFAARGRKLAVLTSSAFTRSGLTQGFVAEAESLGAIVVRRDSYAPGAADFHVASRSLRTFGAEVLFWDGEGREAEALLRQLAADGISIKVCGGAVLSPEQFHAPARGLLEGVTYVAEDWRLAPAQQAQVDSLARARGEHAGALWTRGFLAGRRIADAVSAGARTPAELAARLRHHDADLRAEGFLDLAGTGARLPVFVTAKGRPVELPAP